MHDNFQQFDIQALVDLLAEETEKYTKAFISGDRKKVAEHRMALDALVSEINFRKCWSSSDNKTEIKSN